MTKGVLAHLVSRLTSQRENAATEALAFVLNQSKVARVAFARALSVAGLGEVAVDRVSTQYVAGDESRPDLALLRSDGSLVGFVEAKFWAGLTEAQPTAYLRRLQAGGGGLLVFLAPTRRLPALRAEVVERCQSASLSIEANVHDVLRAGPCGIGFIAWHALLAALEEAAAGGNDGDAVSDIRQLRSLCSTFESEGFVPLARDELEDRETPRRVMSLADLAGDIVAEAVRDGIVSTKGTRSSHGVHWAGRYIALPRAGAWIGLAHFRWFHHGRSPLWLNFGTDNWGRAKLLKNALRAWVISEPPRAYEADDGPFLVPVFIRPGAEKNVVVAAAVEQLRLLDAAMAEAGVPLMTEAAPAPPSDDAA